MKITAKQLQELVTTEVNDIMSRQQVAQKVSSIGPAIRTAEGSIDMYSDGEGTLESIVEAVKNLVTVLDPMNKTPQFRRWRVMALSALKALQHENQKEGWKAAFVENIIGNIAMEYKQALQDFGAY